MSDWHEAYFDLVNKVECECVQQGDLVPIWDQFNRMALTIRKLQGNQAALDAKLAKWKALAETLAGALEGSIGALEFSREYHKDLGNEDQAFAQDRLDAATQALTSYKEQRDA